jgi:hypothetical protein
VLLLAQSGAKSSGSSCSTNPEIPPPEKRLCRKHGKPICPIRWKRGCRTSECSKCTTERQRSPEARKRRANRWEKELIFCKRHLGRRCQKSPYAFSGKRKCASCHLRRSDGSRRLSFVRNSRVQDYKKILKRRKHFQGTLRGLKLFERSTGFNLEQVGFTRKEINEQITST